MEISLIGRRVHVPEFVSRWLDFDRTFSANVMAGDWRNMKKEDVIYAGIQATLAAALVGCAVVGRDLKTQETPSLAYSPSGEIVPVNMFGQDAFFYTAQPAFADLGLYAQQVDVVQLGGSDLYSAFQLIKVQNQKGEIFYNLMFQGKDGQVKQEWAAFLADSPQSPESVLYKLDLVVENGHKVFVANMAEPMGSLTSTQFEITLPGESGIVPVPTADLIGFFTGVHPVLAADESTSTPIATIAPTPKPTATLIFPTPTEFPTLVPTEKPGVHVDNYMGHQGWSASIDIIKSGGSDISADTIKLWTNDPLKRPHDLVFVSTVNNNIEAPEYGRLKGVGLDVMEIAAYEVRDVRVIAQNREELNGAEVNVKLIYMRNGSPHILNLPIRGGFGLGSDEWITDPRKFSDHFKVGDFVNMDLAFDDGVGRFNRDGIINYWANGNNVLKQVYQIAFDGLGDHPITPDWINQKLSQPQVDFGNGNVVVINISHR